MGAIQRLRQNCILSTTPSIFFLYKTKVFHHKNLNQFHKMSFFHRHHGEPSPSRPVVHATNHTTNRQPSRPGVHGPHPAPKFTDNKTTVRFYCKAQPNHSLSIHDGKVVLLPSNSSDPHQHWVEAATVIKLLDYEEGYPAFALVNKATGQAMQHSPDGTISVQLPRFDPHKPGESVLWTRSKDLGDGYHAVRMVNNIKLHLSVYSPSVVKPHGGVVYSTRVFLSEWKKGDNQRWSADHSYI